MFRGLGEKENEKNWKSSNKWTWLFQRIFKLLCIEKKNCRFFGKEKWKENAKIERKRIETRNKRS